ncbi:MAG: hypothetical protein AAGE52_33325 [Myxococcota bacterium]
MRVLFLGNSYTFYNDVPGQVAAMAHEGGVALAVEQVVEGGADWSLHAGRLGGLDAIARRFDTVVLQGRSTDPLLKARRFRKYGAILGKAALAARSRVVLYQTWAWAADNGAYKHGWSKRSPAAWLSVVRNAYIALGRTLSAEVAPVGDAWARAITTTDLDLYDSDRHHASPLGSHLAATVLLATLTDLDPRQIAWRPPDVSERASARLKGIGAVV